MPKWFFRHGLQKCKSTYRFQSANIDTSSSLKLSIVTARRKDPFGRGRKILCTTDLDQVCSRDFKVENERQTGEKKIGAKVSLFA